MSQKQSLGLGGLGYKSTADLSGTVSDVTNGNPIGTKYKNAIGLAVIADVNADSSFVLAADASKPYLGVLDDNPRAGEPGNVQSARGSSAKCLAGAAVTRGDKVMSDAYGRAITLTGGGHHGFGIAMESAAAAGALIEVVLGDHYLA